MWQNIGIFVTKHTEFYNARKQAFLWAWDRRWPTICLFACAGSQMARNLLTALSGIDLVYSVFQNQTVCLVLHLVPHSTAVGGECTRASL